MNGALKEFVIKVVPSELRKSPGWAALVFVLLLLVICALVFFSGYIAFDDTNKDKIIQWDEISGVKFRKVTSHISTWWNYAVGTVVAIYAMFIPIGVMIEEKK